MKKASVKNGFKQAWIFTKNFLIMYMLVAPIGNYAGNSKYCTITENQEIILKYQTLIETKKMIEQHEIQGMINMTEKQRVYETTCKTNTSMYIQEIKNEPWKLWAI